MQLKFLGTALLFSLISTATFAEGVEIDPGEWEMTTTMTMPMLPQPRVSTNIECIVEEELSPENMVESDSESDCTFETTAVNGNTMNWSMDCKSGTGNSKGEWQITSHGDTLLGNGTVTVDVQGQSMVMTMEWTGKRVGDCG